jgi:hypothetical protein
MTVDKASKSHDGFRLKGRIISNHGSLHKRCRHSSPATGILPLSPMRLPAAELDQLCCRMRLLPNGRGVDLPDELRCITLHSLHLKRRQQNRKPCTSNVGSKDMYFKRRLAR